MVNRNTFGWRVFEAYDKEKQMQYTWSRLVCNAYEPDNIIQFVGEADNDGNIETTHIKAHLNFRDGSYFVEVIKNLDGTFTWKNGLRSGIEQTLDEAWKKLPAFVTDPDHWEESQTFKNV